MGLKAAVQALKKAEKLKEKVVNSQDLLNDNEAWVCQQQLQEIYQQVLILDLEYALDKKVEQELWSHGFKKYIATLQSLAKDKKNPKRNESQALLASCLDGASGFYLTLLQDVCTTFDLDLPFRRKDITHGNCKRKVLPTKPHKNSCYYICQHCLVHLGDIARYRNHNQQAEAFYRHAVQLSPSSGQPYNQLALLEASRGDRLSTVFHYMRSIAVRHMFPAAASNLALTFEKCASQQSNKDVHSSSKLTSSEYLSLYLKLHAYFHVCIHLDMCAGYVKLLTDTLTAHIATQSFNSWKLVQMFAINTFAYHHPCRDGEDINQLTSDEKRVRGYVIDLIAGSLNAFLLPVYTLKQDESLLDYFALPAIKLTLEWICLQPEVLSEEGFTKRLQIWPGLCRLLNVLQDAVVNFNSDLYAKLPLPEDRDLQAFLPLEKVFEDLKFDNQESNPAIMNKLRGSRLLKTGNWLADLQENRVITRRPTGTGYIFEAISGTQVMPSSDLIRELEELSLNKVASPSPVPSDTASSRASNTTPELRNPAIEILATLENAQEKRAGILKPQVNIEEGDKAGRNRCRQNVAMQAILRRSQEQEVKQVTFKTPSPSTSPSVAPPQPPSDWRNNNSNNNNNNNMPRQIPPYPPPSFPFPPPSVDNRPPFSRGPPQNSIPPPPPRPFHPPVPWQEDTRPTWWQPIEEHQQPNSAVSQPRSIGYGMSQNQQTSSLPTNDLFNPNWGGVGMKLGPFTPMFTQPPPFTSSRSESANPQVPEQVQQHTQQSSSVVSPTYSLFSPAWATQHHPPPLMSGASIVGQQSLWSGPGPSPLERLLEQQKQLREAPTHQCEGT